MQLLKFVPIKLTLFLVAGILLGALVETSIIFPLLLTSTTCIALAVLFFKNKSVHSFTFGIVAFALTFFMGYLAVTTANPKNEQNHYSKSTTTSQKKHHLKITEVLKSTTFSDRYFAKILPSDNQNTSGKILVSISKDTITSGLLVDDELITFKETTIINPPLNPHQFNYENYLKNLGISAQLYLNTSQYTPLKNTTRTAYGLAANWRNIILGKLKKENFNPENLSVIQALLLGQRNDISEETYDNYKNAGAIHILALSGLHIGILLLILQFLLAPFERLPHGKKIKLFIIVLLLWGFAFLAGLSASIVRAVTMFSFLAYAMYLNRPTNSINILALSLFFILLIKPNYLFQVGFQMSYAAVFSIIWIYPLLQRFWYPKNKIISYFWQLLSVSIAAQLGVLPISLFYFHQFPGLFFLTNLLIIPFLGIILAVGIIISILSLTNLLPSILSDSYNQIISSMNSVVKWVANQDAFIFKNIAFDTLQLLLLYTLIFLMVFAFRAPKFKNIARFLIAIIIFQSYTFISSHATTKTHEIIVLHQSRFSGIIEKTGSTLHFLGNDVSKFEHTLKNYQIAKRIERFYSDSLKNSYTLNAKKITVIDSMGIFPTSKVNSILLTQSPKINLDRLIDSLQPLAIIADGSNYKTDIVRWKATCLKRKLPFHHTGEKGAYSFKLKD